MGLYNRAQLERDLAAVEAFDQEVSRKVAAGEISGFAAVELGRDVQRKIASLRMKLVNAGQMISDLRSAKAEAATAETETETQRAKFRLGAAWRKIRRNSDGRQTAPEPPPEALGSPRSHEVSLDDSEAVSAAVSAGNRLLWRPGGRGVVVVYED